MKKVQDPHCPFCTNIDQTVTYLYLFHVPSRIVFGMTLLNNISLYQQKKTLSLSKNKIIYGVLNGWPSCPSLNHLILIAKYFLYYKALNKVKFQFADFVNLVHEK